jgi:hypothetical protein
MEGECIMNSDLLYFLLGVLVTIIFSYYFYKKGLRIKEPVYSIKSVNWISGSTSTLKNLSISYLDRKVESLTVSKILFYNRGSETIHRQDIETIDRLNITSTKYEILSADVLQANNPSNKFQIDYDEPKNYIFFEFDYLDKNQGAIIEIIHTGLSSEDLNISGDIKGVQRLTQVNPEQLIAKSAPAFETKWVVVTALFTLMFWYLLRSGRMQSMFPSGNSFMEMLGMVFIVGGVSATLMTAIIALASVFNVFTESYFTPDGLEKFTE